MKIGPEQMSGVVAGPTWDHPLETGNNSPLLSDINALKPLRLLNIATFPGNVRVMRQMLLSGLLAFALSGQMAAAQCYADYKAKQDNPLRLHYGVAEIQGGCSAGSAQAELRPRLAQAGWTLLNIVSVFGSEGLSSRKDSAGPYFLRF